MLSAVLFKNGHSFRDGKSGWTFFDTEPFVTAEATVDGAVATGFERDAAAIQTHELVWPTST